MTTHLLNIPTYGGSGNKMMEHSANKKMFVMHETLLIPSSSARMMFSRVLLVLIQRQGDDP